MSFTDGHRRVATKADCDARWEMGKPGERFRCHLCGYKFAVGDGWRWQVMMDTATNFLVCDACDGPDVKERWLHHVCEFKSPKYWVLRRRRG